MFLRRTQIANLALALAAVLALAACRPQPRDERLARYDADGDGLISWTEAQQDPDLAHAFMRADKNGDGVLDPDEFHVALLLARGAAVRDRMGG